MIWVGVFVRGIVCMMTSEAEITTHVLVPLSRVCLCSSRVLKGPKVAADTMASKADITTHTHCLIPLRSTLFNSTDAEFI